MRWEEALVHRDRLLASIARFQAALGEPVPVVGGTAAALHAGHRLSLDADYALPDLRERYEELLDFLEARDDWSTARTNYGVLILGNFQGVETGLRQLRRDEPLEVETLETRYGLLTVPTCEEMIRIKGWMILVRNAARDYLDFAALTAHAGEARTREALEPFDAIYRDVDARGRARDTLPSMQLLRQLAEPRPNDLDQRLLADYREIAPEWSDWRRVASQCEAVAETLALSLGASPNRG